MCLSPQGLTISLVSQYFFIKQIYMVCIKFLQMVISQYASKIKIDFSLSASDSFFLSTINSWFIEILSEPLYGIVHQPLKQWFFAGLTSAVFFSNELKIRKEIFYLWM